METYLIYIGKVAVATGAFYLAFLVLFQNQKHFRFNRVYLPVSLALSFVVPLITFTSVEFVEPQIAPNFAELGNFANSIQTIQQPAFVFEWYHYLSVLYGLGVFAFLLNLLIGHFKAISIVRKSKTTELFRVKVNVVQKDVHPFSFFNKIVLSKQTLKNPALEMIVEHENIHVREKHTFDILFAEILFVLQWFNPFAWLIKAAVKNNLEYITDHQIAQKHNPQNYQLAMVSLAHKQGVAPFLNALNGSQLKNRIIMMKKKKGSKYTLLKQLAVLPLLAVLIMGLSGSKVKTQIAEHPNPVATTPEGNALSAGFVPLQTEKTIEGKVSNNIGEPLIGAAVYIKGTTTGTVSDANGNFEIIVSGPNATLVFNFAGYDKREIQVGDQKKMDVTLYANRDGEAKRKVEVLNVQSDENGKVDNVVSDTVDMKGSVGDNLELKPASSKGLKVRTLGKQDKQPIYVVDGEIVENIESIKPDDIESISVLKDASSVAMYGEKGENGVILISTKKKNKDVLGKIEGNPAVIVDGKKYSSIEAANIDPNEIASVSVLKGETAFIKVYGEQAENGVVIINTKTKFNSGKMSLGATTLEAEQMPQFPGGELALRHFLDQYTRYPEIAKENGIEGKVYVTFVVEKNGKVSGAKIAKGLAPALDKEALRVVNTLPDWKPGLKNGEPAAISYMVPVIFKIDE